MDGSGWLAESKTARHDGFWSGVRGSVRGLAGGLTGATGGPAAPVTIPGGAYSGAAIFGALGTAAGYALGTTADAVEQLLDWFWLPPFPADIPDETIPSFPVVDDAAFSCPLFPTPGMPITVDDIPPYPVLPQEPELETFPADGPIDPPIYAAGNASDAALHEAYKEQLRRQMSKPYVQDPYLAHLMDDLYRDNATVGSGSTADAITTGEPVGGGWHSTKGEGYIIALEKWLTKNPTASSSDRAAAENVLLDLKDALGR